MAGNSFPHLRCARTDRNIDQMIVVLLHILRGLQPTHFFVVVVVSVGGCASSLCFCCPWGVFSSSLCCRSSSWVQTERNRVKTDEFVRSFSSSLFGPFWPCPSPHIYNSTVEPRRSGCVQYRGKFTPARWWPVESRPDISDLSSAYIRPTYTTYQTYCPIFLSSYRCPTNNALSIKFRLSSNGEILLISTDWAYKLVPNVQKCVCNVCTFRLSFHFCVPPSVVGYESHTGLVTCTYSILGRENCATAPQL